MTESTRLSLAGAGGEPSVQVTHRRRYLDVTTLLYVVLNNFSTSGVLAARDLTGDDVFFEMRNAATGFVKIPATQAGVSVTSAATGLVQFAFPDVRVDEPGIYYGSFVVDDGSGNFDTYPARHDGLRILLDGDRLSAEEAYFKSMQGLSGIAGFPDQLQIGQTYDADLSNNIICYLLDASGNAVNGVGDHLFADEDFAPTLRISQGSQHNLVEGTCSFSSSAGALASPSVLVGIPQSETVKPSPGYARAELVANWDGNLSVSMGQQVVEWLGRV